jgi:hypothetical protein
MAWPPDILEICGNAGKRNKKRSSIKTHKKVWQLMHNDFSHRPELISIAISSREAALDALLL